MEYACSTVQNSKLPNQAVGSNVQEADPDG
jgi:hypothetical protein